MNTSGGKLLTLNALRGLRVAFMAHAPGVLVVSHAGGAEGEKGGAAGGAGGNGAHVPFSMAVHPQWKTVEDASHTPSVSDTQTRNSFW